MEASHLNTDNIMLGDGTRFTRTPLGNFGGQPTPGQVAEIQGQFSDHTRIALVRTNHVGENRGFEIDYYLREM
jgi:hypothetical protein